MFRAQGRWEFRRISTGWDRRFSGSAKLWPGCGHQDGCPWDREQTLESIKPFTLEETYELLEAIDAGDDPAIVEELGMFCSRSSSMRRSPPTKGGSI